MSEVNKKMVQGLGTFNTAYSVQNDNFEDEPTELDFKEYLKLILASVANKIPFNSTFYVRVVNNVASVKIPLNEYKWNVGDIVFDKFDNALYRVDGTLSAPIFTPIGGTGGGTNVVANPGGTIDEELNTILIGNKTYEIKGGVKGAYVVKVEKTSSGNVDNIKISQKDDAGNDQTVEFKTGPNKYVKESKVNGKILEITNVENDGSETTTSYGADTGGFATAEQLNAEIQNRKNADDTKVDKKVTSGDWVYEVANTPTNDGPSMTAKNDVDNTQVGIAVNNNPNTLAEIYAVDKDTKLGTRVIVRKNKVFYTKDKTTQDVAANEEIARLKDIPTDLVKYEAGDNISFTPGTGTNQKINSNQINDTLSTSALKTYSIDKILSLINKRTLREIDDGAGNKALIFNENDGGGAKFEDSTSKINSFVGVNKGGVSGYGAQLYTIELNNDGTIKKGSWLDVTRDGIYYYSGDYKTSDLRDVNDNKLATIKDISTDFEKKLTAGDNITIDRTDADHPKISSNQVDDTNISTSKAYSNKKTDDLLAKKVNILETGTNGKAFISNEDDGGGAKFENNNGEHSFVGVNNGTIGAQIYQIDKDTKVGTRINVTKDAIYYTKGKADTTHAATDEIATKNDVETETTRATTAEGTLNTAIGTEKTRAEAAEQALENKFADYDTKTEINTKLADYAKSTDVYAKTDTYSQTEVNTELAKKANDFDIDTATLQWDTTGTLRKLKAIIPAAMHFKTSKDYVSEVLAITTHEDGDLYWAWKDDRTEPQATAPVVNAFIVWSGTDNKWVYAGSTEVDLTDYLKKTDAESTYAKINDVYAKTDTYSRTEVNTELAKKQDLLVSQNNISSIGANVASQISLIDNSIINITIDGGEITGTFSDIKISIDAVNCKIIGQDHYELTAPKTSLPPTLQVKFTDFTGTAPDDVEVKLDGVALVKDTDYKWGGDTGNLKLLETCMNKLKLDSSCELTIKCEGV